MKTYIFSLELYGTGKTPEEAWREVVQYLAMNPEDPPDYRVEGESDGDGTSVVETLPQSEILRREKDAKHFAKNAMNKRLLQRISQAKLRVAAELYARTNGRPQLPVVVEVRASEGGMTRRRLFKVTQITAVNAIEGPDIVR
jgi:hypothetical protein